MSQPWIKFYTSDWRSDPALRMCSIGARGLWLEMICVMHEADPYGSLLVNSQQVSPKQLAALAAVTPRDAATYLAELEAAGVFSREDNGTVYSRRMRRDREKADRDKANGKGGGNPTLKGGVNPQDKAQDKAQIPEARKKEDAAEAAPEDPEKELFRRGKEVCGQDAGGLIAKLLKAKNRNVPLARAAIEMASTKHKPREYLGAVIAGGEPSGDGKRLTNDEAFYGVGRIPGIT